MNLVLKHVKTPTYRVLKHKVTSPLCQQPIFTVDEILVTRDGRDGRPSMAATPTWRSEVWELRRVQETGHIPRRVAYSRTIAASAKAELWAKAQWLLDESKSRGSRPDVVVFNSAILGYERSRHWRLALQLFEEISWSRVAPSTPSYNSVMGACAWGKLTATKALDLLQQLRNQRLQASEITYTAAIKACETCRDWLRALELLQEMKEDHLVPNRIVLTAVIATFKEARLWWEAAHLLAIMRQSGHVPNVVSCNAVISACERCGAWTQALHAFSEAEDQIIPDDVTFNALISAFEKGRQWQLALHILSAMKGSSIELDVISYSAAISACEKALQWERALELLAEMRTEEIVPNMITVNAAISACSNGIKWHLALQLLGFSASDGLFQVRRHADATTQSALITATGFGLEWESSLALLTMPTGKLDTVAVNSGISACERAERWCHAVNLLDFMAVLRLAASILTFNALLDGCVRAAQWLQGLEALRSLRGASLQADVTTRSVAVMLPGQLGFLEKTAEGEANAVTYAAALEACLEAGTPTAVPRLADELHLRSLRITQGPRSFASDEVGASAVVSALDLLDGENLLRDDLPSAFRAINGATFAALQGFRGGRSLNLEMLPGFGGPLDPEAMRKLGLLRLDAHWLPQARCNTRQAAPFAMGAKPTAKGLTSWSADSAVCRGRSQGYQRGYPEEEQQLHAIVAEHDRSAHAERQALLKVLRQLVENDWILSYSLMVGAQSSRLVLNRDVGGKQGNVSATKQTHVTVFIAEHNPDHSAKS
eukprot:s1208_g10.t1